MTEMKAFEARVPELRVILARRRASWTLSTMAWEDVEVQLLTRLWQKWSLFRPDRGPLENWANTVISRALSNLLRDNLMKFSKPCSTAGAYGGQCVFNQAGDACGYTPSGLKCTECPLYKRWTVKKQAQYNINASLPLDTHIQEVQNTPSDFLDIEGIKPQIDAFIIKRLNKHDGKVYRLLYIDNKSVEEVAKRMKYKTPKSGRTSQVIRKLVARFKDLARDAIETLDL